ncbi:MAG TPA: class I poly(R)-hydroxyalkanoic acid synthase [Micropepsaceae bacterium]|nr:class I poly(R)-hydroxyalkanoic acid synthase [Micropepsaceae bacterium]
MAKETGTKKAADKEAKPAAVPPEAEAAPAASYRLGDAEAFGRNMARVAAKSQHLLSEFLKRQTERFGQEPFDPLNVSAAFFALLKQMAANPSQMLNAQIALWHDYLTLLQRTTQRAFGGTVLPMVAPAAGDRRFRDKDWQENQIFDFIKQSYLLTANWLQKTVAGVQGMDERTQARAAFYARQFADAVSPSNFVLTNPEVLRETLRSNGENLVRGLDNLLFDLERGQGQLSIRQTTDNFVVGRDIATTPGKVMFRNDLFELLQYNPTTKSAYETPLLIFPPWINKFYILDLQPKNSFVKWAVDQGYTVFIVSWVNPDSSLAEKSFEDYMREGIFAALDAVEKATGQRQVNTVGYCIAGTLLAATLAYIAASGEYKNRIKSTTFLAAQVDFSQAGDLQIFVDDVQLAAMEKQMRAAGGVLEGSKMALTFNMLRSNDLIWSFVVNNYLLGKEPVPFDLLYWNSDTTRMPLKLHLAYLRECYRDNALAQAEMMLGGQRLNIAKIKTPAFFQAAKEDHIAPAVSVYKGAKLFAGPVNFVLAGSGHIAGVINPPAAGKYQHWTNDQMPATLEEWQADATEHVGSWWPTWDAWLAPRSGEKIPAPKPGDGELNLLGDAPGNYVLVKAGTMNHPKKRAAPR